MEDTRTAREIIEQALASRPGEPLYASVTFDSRSGGSIRLQPGTGHPFGQIVGKARDLQPLLDAYPALTAVCDGLIAHGGGITLRRGAEEHYIGFPLVRGHGGPSQAELDGLPEWAYLAYLWRCGA